jgi:hypothetical protein
MEVRAMSDLLKRTFELFVKNRWLKTIDKETNKYNKLKSKLFRQQYVVNALLEEYKKIYNVDLRLSKNGRSDGNE